MLVLSRKTDERIHIGDNIVVTIIRVRGNVVRLGIDAPAEVRVLRAELAEENPARATDGPAAKSGGGDATP